MLYTLHIRFYYALSNWERREYHGTVETALFADEIGKVIDEREKMRLELAAAGISADLFVTAR
jgi:hypothetical protein